MLNRNEHFTSPMLTWLERRPWNVTDLPSPVRDAPTTISLDEKGSPRSPWRESDTHG